MMYVRTGALRCSTWNGAAVTGTEISYSDMMQGGKLEFTMGSKPAYQTADQEL